MGIFFRNVVLFIGFAALFYTLCLAMWDQFLPPSLKGNLQYKMGGLGHLNSRIKDLKSYGNVDVVFVGSSLAYRGFDPRIFKTHGLASFNLGSSGQTFIQTEVLTNRYLGLLNPKLVVCETYPQNFSHDGVEPALDLIANDKNDIETIKMALRINHIKVYNTLLYGLFRDVFSMNDAFVEDIVKKDKEGRDDTYIRGGFVEK